MRYDLVVARAGRKTTSNSNDSSIKLVDRISLGVLTDAVPRDFIEDCLNETGKREQRKRSLPAHVMVRFCQAMCLFPDDDYEEVIRKLAGSLRSMDSWSDDWQVPTTSAITQARQRLGPEPLALLFQRVAEPVAELGTKGAWLRSRRLMAMDGFHLDVPDTPDNLEEFGRRNNGGHPAAYPQVLIVGLGECGSHALIDAAMGRGQGGDERALAAELIPSVTPDMLVLADRNFFSFALWTQSRSTGSDLLWRVSSGLGLPVLEWLEDGSYLSVVIHPRARNARRAGVMEAARLGHELDPADAIRVRVVEYDVPGRGENDEVVCVLTSILDPREASAVELAAAYHERWEFESLIDEVKTHQRGPGRVLRSKSPQMVYQEIWAMLLTHYAIRRLMCRAADEADVDPDRLSFVRSLRIVRRHVTEQADFSP